MNCKACQSEMPELVLNAASPASADLQAHLASCSACQEEFASFQSTFALLDSWRAPEPSPYFDQKFAVRLREEQANPPANWLERLQTRLLLNTGRQFRPAMVGAMALVLVLGGGTFAGVSSLPSHHEAQVSATVGDLQILDKNDQAIQQMDQLLQDEDSPDDNTTPPAS